MRTDTELRDVADQPQPNEPGDRKVAGPRSSRRRDAVIIVVALLVGMGGFAAYGALTGDDDTVASPVIEGEVDPGPATPLPEGATEIPAGSPASSAQAAVAAFLDAEVAGDFESSFSLLSEAQRAEYGSVAQWRNAHADFFPVVGHRSIEGSDDTVRTEVEYRSSLDEVVGLIPARGTVEWAVVREGDGWLVDFDASAVQPIFPDEGEAPEAVRTWAADMQRCEEPDQYEGALVATADLVRIAESLCDRPGALEVGQPRTLDEFDATPLVSAFGTEALSWARAVDITGPVDIAVVVAPVDDRWLVVGFLPT